MYSKDATKYGVEKMEMMLMSQTQLSMTFNFRGEEVGMGYERRMGTASRRSCWGAILDEAPSLSLDPPRYPRAALGLRPPMARAEM
jgi:hypothetical protein